MEASHPEQGTLHAWVEGELDGAEHQRIEAHLAECARCREAVAEARGLIAGASRIVAALDGAPAGVVPSRRRFGARRPRFAPARWAAAAAVLLFAATSVVVSREFRSGDVDLPIRAIETAPPEELASPPAPTLPAPAAPASSATGNLRESGRSVATAVAPGTRAVSRAVDRRREVRVGAAPQSAAPSVQYDPSPARVSAESDFSRQGVVGEVAAAAPAAAVPPPAMRRADPRSAEQSVRVDTVYGSSRRVDRRIVRVVRYEAESGVIVTLTEYEEPPRDAGVGTGAAAPMRPQGEAVSQRSAQALPVPGIRGQGAYMWLNPRGNRLYILTGPLPAAELESLARRLGELKVVR